MWSIVSLVNILALAGSIQEPDQVIRWLDDHVHNAGNTKRQSIILKLWASYELTYVHIYARLTTYYQGNEALEPSAQISYVSLYISNPYITMSLRWAKMVVWGTFGNAPK